MKFVVAVQICSVKFGGCFSITDFTVIIIIAIYYHNFMLHSRAIVTIYNITTFTFHEVGFALLQQIS